ncbi:Phomenoic acid biosynthesis cluster-specific transcriptional regulator-like protein [Cladobotryum mycophilum]|uniref:Phomenoic acid biosynthesis cluster-specific transcriptional regulator-like protein n=1 Tax=Cladobotryum mycophilum TaxID=491253 RepID=A0ABR0SGW9_9HYPO
MASTGIQSDAKHCWECFRRGTIYDGSIPVCGNCRRAGIVCPGYGNKKPLVFLPPGKVTRLQNSDYLTSGGPRNLKTRGRAISTTSRSRPTRSSNYRFKAALGSRSDGVQPNYNVSVEEPTSAASAKREVVVRMPYYQVESTHRSLRSSDLRSLEPPGWGYIELMRFYNDVVIPTATSKDILVVGGYSKMNGPTLGQMSPSIYINNSSSWRAHVSGLLSLIKQCGGPRKMMSSSSTKPYALQNFIIIITLYNTLGPRDTQIAEVTHLDLGDIEDIYNYRPATMFLCPGPIFLDTVRINRLRLSPRSTSPSASNTEICRILQHIDACPTEDWTEMTSPSHLHSKYISPVADVHKSAVAVFGALAIPCTAGSDSRMPCESCDRLYRLHRASLFRLLDTAMENERCRTTVPWPVIVAGIASRTGTLGEQGLIELYLETLRQDLSSRITPQIPLRMLRKFWQSGKKDWDDCFDKPYPLIV